MLYILEIMAALAIGLMVFGWCWESAEQKNLDRKDKNAD